MLKARSIVGMMLIGVLTTMLVPGAVLGQATTSEIQEGQLADLLRLQKDQLPQPGDDGDTEAFTSDFGQARILKQRDPFKYYNLRAGAFAGHNSNVRLAPETPENDRFHSQTVEFTYRPNLKRYVSNTRAGIYGTLQRTIFDEFNSQFSFSTLLLGTDLSYSLARSRALYANLEFQDIYSGQTPGENTSQQKGIFELGARQIFRYQRYHQFIANAGITTEESFEVQGPSKPGDPLDSAKDIYKAGLTYYYPYTRSLSLIANGEVQKRDYHHQGTSVFNSSGDREDQRLIGTAGLNYKLSEAFKARLNGSITQNDSNQQNLLGQERDFTQWQIILGVEYNTSFHEFSNPFTG
jgi:hypothetical protein